MAGGRTSSPADAGDAVVLAIRAIADDLDATLGRALLDRPDGVHAHRKAVRRLRSTLAAYRPFFATDDVRQLHDAYRAWGRDLGEPRDLEVRLALAERLADELVAEETTASADGLVRTLRAGRERAHRHVAQRGVSTTARQRRDALDTFLATPPRTPKAARGVKRGVRRRLVKEGERVLRRADAAARSPGDETALHELRKAARRLRYAVEAVTRPPVGLFGAKAERLAACAERVHDLLGEHRDAAGLAGFADQDPSAAPGIAARARAEAAVRLQELPGALAEVREALERFR